MATISTVRGDTKTITCTCTYATDGSAVNLTDKIVYFTVKKAVDNDPIDSVNLIAKQYTTGTSSGIAQFVLSTSDTTLPHGNYQWNIRISDSSATQVLSTYNGMFSIIHGVTNRV